MIYTGELVLQAAQLQLHQKSMAIMNHFLNFVEDEENVFHNWLEVGGGWVSENC